MRTVIPLLILSVAACGLDPDDAPELGETTQASNVAMVGNPLDAPLGKQGVADLRTSQLIRLPASWFLDASVDVSNAHRMVVRTSCGAAATERRDSGLVVVKSRWMGVSGWQVVDARYNDDIGTGVCPTCSQVDLGSVTSGQYRYTVYAFSNRRTKAQCFVEYSTAAGGTSFNTKIAPPDHDRARPLDLGGALVELGPVERNTDWLEVLTTNDGGNPRSSTDSKMLVFDVGGTQITDTATHRSVYAPVLARDKSSNDRDARIAGLGYNPIVAGLCATPPCAEPKHFAVVGTEPNPSGFQQVEISTAETTVSLMRGPEDNKAFEGGVAEHVGPLTVSPGKRDQCGTAIDLGIGRFAATVRASSRAEYGEDRGIHGDMSWQIRNWGYPRCTPSACPAPIEPPDDDLRGYFYRGTPNFLGFTMRVQARSSTTAPWTAVTPARQVPNGAFGCVAGGCLDTFLEDFELYKPSQVRLCIDNADARIAFEGTWGARRNAPSAELKLATFNGHHGDQGALDSGGIENDAEARNMSNLLATRGRFDSAARTVIERATDARFEWNADVVALQENSELNSYESFLAQAESQTDLDWRYVWGYGKNHDSTGYQGKNAVITHSLLMPSGTLLPPGDQCGATTDPTLSADGQAQCLQHNDAGQWDEVDYKTYSVPGQISVRRWGQNGDVPVLVLSVMMQPGHKYQARRSELASLIAKLKIYVADHPELVGATSTADPSDPNIRIVLAGDFNMYPHRTGENRWFVRELRAVFGYAVDTAAAHRDSHRNFYDMHAWRGVPNGSWVHAPEGDNGMPLSYLSAQDWRELDNTTTWWFGTSMSWPHVFPYWARTFFGSDHDYDSSDAGHDRHDAVLLVGQGWSHDDAVRGYVVMNTTAEFDEYNDASNNESHGSPFAIRDQQGRVVAVDIAPGEDGAHDRDVPNPAGSDGRPHYQPQFDLGDGHDACTQPGCAAVESDHIPVGVRLRISATVKPLGGALFKAR